MCTSPVGSPALGLFPLLFAEWQAADAAASDAWAQVWASIDELAGETACGPPADELCEAMRLRYIASEWLKSVHVYLNEMRREVRIL